jgi:hypothetical protein
VTIVQHGNVPAYQVIFDDAKPNRATQRNVKSGFRRVVQWRTARPGEVPPLFEQRLQEAKDALALQVIRFYATLSLFDSPWLCRKLACC